MWCGTGGLPPLGQLAMMMQQPRMERSATAGRNRKEHAWHPGDVLEYLLAFPCPNGISEQACILFKDGDTDDTPGTPKARKAC